MNQHWLGVVSHAHVRLGVQGGFAQVCHGRKGLLSKMKAGDGLIYYSPAERGVRKRPVSPSLRSAIWLTTNCTVSKLLQTSSHFVVRPTTTPSTESYHSTKSRRPLS